MLMLVVEVIMVFVVE